jgi:hypothetical protein
MNDHIVDEVRRIREEQAAKWNFDVKAILADARKRQARSGHRVVSVARKRKVNAQQATEAAGSCIPRSEI